MTQVPHRSLGLPSHVLEIRVRSGLHTTGGSGLPGGVDSDVVFDGAGLPRIPARRLKGLWRDACRDVADAAEQCGTPLAVEVSDLFGRRGAQSAGPLAMMDATLSSHPTIEPWLAWLVDSGTVGADEVAEQVTTIRGQTAIDRKTGAPAKNTLRFTRLLREDLVFRAEVRLDPSVGPQGVRLLALGAAALQHMGRSRTRGWGEVTCRFLATSGESIEDLTSKNLEAGVRALGPEALEQAAQAPTAGGTAGGEGPESPPESSFTDTGTGEEAPPRGLRLLRYRLELLAEAALPGMEGDPNTIVTQRHIPGSAMQGVFAWRYLARPGASAEDTFFGEAFLSGGVRFLAAYPSPAETPGDERLLPVPHSIRKRKDNGRLVDLVAPTPADVQVTRPGRKVVRVVKNWQDGARVMMAHEVETSLSYHHARALDRRWGRALGNEVPEGGTLFRTEALSAGQCFVGALLGDRALLTTLRGLVADKTTVLLGRSRGTQYGGNAKLVWLDAEPEVPAGPEWRSWRPEELAPDPPVDDWDDDPPGETETADQTAQEEPTFDTVVLTCLSPILATNDAGHPTASLPLDELTARLGVQKVVVEEAWTRTEVVGGYQSHLRLPRPQWPSISAGSVFRLRISPPVTLSRLRDIEHDGVGLRRGEGFGRVAVQRHGPGGLEVKDYEMRDMTRAARRRPTGTVPLAVTEYVRGVLVSRALREARATAAALAATPPRKDVPSASLLRRVSTILDRRGPAATLDALAGFAGPARSDLARCKILGSGVAIPQGQIISLRDALDQWLADPDCVAAQVLSHVASRPPGDVASILGSVPPASQADLERITSVLISSLCSELARRNRPVRARPPQPNTPEDHHG